MVLTLTGMTVGREDEVRYPATFHIGFGQPSEEHVNEINRRLKEDGFDVPPPSKQHGSWTFYFRAPGGFLIEFLAQRVPFRPSPIARPQCGTSVEVQAGFRLAGCTAGSMLTRDVFVIDLSRGARTIGPRTRPYLRREDCRMRIDDLKKAKDRRPYQPFQIRAADGREIAVTHPDAIAWGVAGSARTVVCVLPGGRWEVINSGSITSLHMPAPGPAQ